ncbi:hypothetical protein FBU59_000413 [Linderina macrospora]|uniref:Uncharacterized protein n=1 Tax=Linderina macrospora TaxID=4868 RepID=A0ACC1JH06_9FUNG|nr:hypothetical protein FBU59_000413 [Linderina macrospora]
MFRSTLARSLNVKSIATPALQSQTRGIRYYMNKVILIGNVGSDPKDTKFEDGKMMSSFPLATSRRYKDKDGNLLEHTAWHRIRFTGDNAERVSRLVKKSALVQVEGSIRYDTYTNKENVEVNSTTISGDSFKILVFPKRPEEGQAKESEE